MRTTKVLSITLPEAMLEQAKKRAKKENRTVSELVREALRQYEATRWLDDIRPYAEERARAAGVLTEEDVNRVIHEYREEKRARAETAGAKKRKAS
jgi:metal-responsive CopG/Arc/MetJ family transcriptional regulator